MGRGRFVLVAALAVAGCSGGAASTGGGTCDPSQGLGDIDVVVPNAQANYVVAFHDASGAFLTHALPDASGHVTGTIPGCGAITVVDGAKEHWVTAAQLSPGQIVDMSPPQEAHHAFAVGAGSGVDSVVIGSCAGSGDGGGSGGAQTFDVTDRCVGSDGKIAVLGLSADATQAAFVDGVALGAGTVALPPATPIPTANLHVVVTDLYDSYTQGNVDSEIVVHGVRYGASAITTAPIAGGRFEASLVRPAFGDQVLLHFTFNGPSGLSEIVWETTIDATETDVTLDASVMPPSLSAGAVSQTTGPLHLTVDWTDSLGAGTTDTSDFVVVGVSIQDPIPSRWVALLPGGVHAFSFPQLPDELAPVAPAGKDPVLELIYAGSRDDTHLADQDFVGRMLDPSFGRGGLGAVSLETRSSILGSDDFIDGAQ